MNIRLRNENCDLIEQLRQNVGLVLTKTERIKQLTSESTSGLKSCHSKPTPKVKSDPTNKSKSKSPKKSKNKKRNKNHKRKKKMKKKRLWL